MHITVRPTMHEIHQQRRLDYAAFSSQFRARTSPQLVKSPVITPESNLQAKLPVKSAPPYRRDETTSNVRTHLTVADLFARFQHDTKTPRGSIPIWKAPTTPHPYGTRPYLTIGDLRAHSAQSTTSSASRQHTHNERLNHNASTPPHKHIAVATSSSL